MVMNTVIFVNKKSISEPNAYDEIYALGDAVNVKITIHRDYIWQDLIYVFCAIFLVNFSSITFM